MMKCKGDIGVVEYDDASKMLCGEVVGTRAVIHFQSGSAGQIEKEFHKLVDFYLASCAKRGKPPEKPFSGKFALRMPTELHRRALSFWPVRPCKNWNAEPKQPFRGSSCKRD